ncbi:glutamic acid-rich [Cystoisospora suis]|uniref:Glutamic acid-rich n=1 Tax=Cystoisospora suis TaxID=483139 RepID=A0A2C6KTJ8_9APIC|nr:glutamic acid-rich [Cystoisospora suis]
MMMSARSIDIHSPVSDLPGRKEGSRASGDSGEEENTHEVVRAEGLFSWSEEDEQPERDEESVRERCGRSPRRSRTTGRDADTTTQGGIIFNLTEEDEHVVEETPESHVGPLREGGSGQQRRTRTAARGSSGACTWTRTKPCGAKTQIDSEEHAADGVGDVPVPSHTTSGQEENKQSGPSSSTCDEDDVGPQMSGECWCPEDESFWDRPQGEWPYDPERQEEGEREQGSDGGGGGIRVRRIEFCRDTASIDDIRLMLVKSNAEAHVVQKVVYNLKARDSIIAQVMKQLSSLLAQSIEMHWQRQELLLRQQELEKEGRCCTTEESADSEVQDPRQKEAAFEGLDHSAFLSEPVFTKRKEEALFVSSSVASANGPQLEPPRDRSVLDSTPACTLTEKPVVEADSGSREHQKTEGGDAASKTPPPTSSPISCAKASDPVHSEAAPASSVAVPAVDCNLPCEDKVEEERAEACSGQSRFAEDSNTFEPQTQPAAMRISPAEWERVLQTHRVKVEELTSMMHVGVQPSSERTLKSCASPASGEGFFSWPFNGRA